jgi:hypothetical protein
MARAPKGKKARKAAPVKARVKKRSIARLQAIAPDTGPVTLEEARALVRAKRPTLAFQDVGKTAAPPASPAAVGAARQKLKKEQRDERARRIREYKATMEIRKGAAPGGRKASRRTAENQRRKTRDRSSRCRSSPRGIPGSIIRSRFSAAVSSRASSAG